MAGGRKAKQSLRADREGPRVGEARGGGAGSCAHSWRSRGIRHGPLPLAGWGDLPGELHGEILRLVPLRDATAARGVSREMRAEVDEVWWAWGIRATAEDGLDDAFCDQLGKLLSLWKFDFAPLVVDVFVGSHAHHLASLGHWWLALLVAEGPDLNGITWQRLNAWYPEQSPLMVAVRAGRPLGRGADGKVEWAYVLGEEEVARAVRVAVAMGADVNRRLRDARPLMTYCAGRGCLEAVKACLAAGAEVDAEGGVFHSWKTALVHAARGGSRGGGGGAAGGGGVSHGRRARSR